LWIKLYFSVLQVFNSAEPLDKPQGRPSIFWANTLFVCLVKE
jgi:hypothetical protein